MKRAIPFHIIIALFCVIVMSLFLPLLDRLVEMLIPQRRSSRLPRQCLHHHKSDILGSRLMKLGCCHFSQVRWV